MITAVAGARHGPETAIDVTLRTHDAEQAAAAIDRIRSSVDPGPLALSFDSPALVLTDARDSIKGQIGKLELLVAPIVALCLFGALGLGAGLTSALAAAISSAPRW